MKRTTANVAAAWSAHDHWTAEPYAIACRGDIVGKHVVRVRHEIHELHFGDRAHAHVCSAGGRTDDCNFRNWCVNDTRRSEAFLQSFRDLECSTIRANVFTEAKDVRVTFHFLKQSLPDRLKIGDFRHRTSPNLMRAHFYQPRYSRLHETRAAGHLASWRR